MKGVKLKQINHFEIQAPPMPKKSTLPAKGHELSLTCYSNILCCAKRKSGKSWAVFNLVKECAGKETRVIAFCSTLYKDDCWNGIRKYLKQKNIDFTGYTSLYPDGQDILSDLIDDLNDEAKEREENDEEESEKEKEPEKDDIDAIMEKIRTHGMAEYLEMCKEEKRKPKKPKFQEPEIMIILDDIGNQLKTPSLLKLLTWNRHFRAKVIISTQYLCHLLPESRKMIDLWLIFAGHPEAKLKAIYDDADINIPFEDFQRLYKKATKHKHSFLYIDSERGEFRKNFNQKFIIKPPEEE